MLGGRKGEPTGEGGPGSLCRNPRRVRGEGGRELRTDAEGGETGHCSLLQEMEGPSFVGRGQGRKQADLQGQPQGRGGDHKTPSTQRHEVGGRCRQHITSCVLSTVLQGFRVFPWTMMPVLCSHRAF